jgi:glycosyltransferase involved in cell wall biosynthesis
MKFSIITCTYNSEKLLPKIIASVKQQAFADFEHIFVDGFSTDGTIEMIKNYQAEYPDKVKFFQAKPQGISNAMNESIRHSSGEYIIHLHSDDSFFDNQVLADVNKFLTGQNYDWIYGKINVIEEDGRTVGVFPKRKIWQLGGSFGGKQLLKYFNYIPHQAVFIRRAVFDKFGYFDETISSAMDPDLWLRIKDKTQWKFFDRVISNYCLRAGAQSSSLKNIQKNCANQRLVQRRHLNWLDILISRFVNFLATRRNQNLR